VSDTVVLSLRAPLARDLDAACVAPDRFATLSAREIAELPVWAGRTAARLGDFFDVHGERSARVCIEGDTARVSSIGRGMRGGKLDVEGSAGHETGLGMAGGTLVVHGDVGHGAGVAMAGGVLCI